jgi:uncharacterized protein YjiS (DUF1127 family)
MMHLRQIEWMHVLRPLGRDPLTTLRLWQHRLRVRHELSRLDAGQMHDTGLDPAVVRREAEKPFWQV